MKESTKVVEVVKQVEPSLNKDSGIGVYIVPGASNKGKLCFYWNVKDLYNNSVDLYTVVIPTGAQSAHTEEYKTLVDVIRPLSEEEKVLYPQEVVNIEASLARYKAFLSLSRQLDTVSNDYYNTLVTYEGYNTHFQREMYKGFFEAVDNLTKLTEEVFFKDNLFIKSHVQTKQVDIYILFPDVQMTNSLGKKHVVKDLVVKLNMSVAENAKGQYKVNLRNAMSGTRLTTSVEEYNSQYRHSHLNHRSSYEFSEFCLGSSEIAIIHYDIKQVAKFDDIKFVLFLNMLESYVKWESLEGGPHIKMSQINSRRNSFSISQGVVDFLRRLVDESPLDFNVNYEGDSLKVIADDTLDTSLKSALAKSGVGEHNFYCIASPEGGEYTFESTPTDAASLKSYERELNSNAGTEAKGLAFPSRKAGLKIYVNSEHQTEKTLSKKITTTVVKYLQEKINKYYKDKQ